MSRTSEKFQKKTNKLHIDFRALVLKYEYDLITTAMNKAFDNQSLAARILGISRTTLIKKLREIRMING